MPFPALTDTQTGSLEAAIKAMDPDGTFVSIDVGAGTVSYCEEIQQDEHISTIRGSEEVVRAYIVTWLLQKGGYPARCLRLEKRYPYGSGGSAELDIRVAKVDSDEAYALIETKSPSAYRGDEDPAIQSQLFSFAGTEPGVKVLSLATVVVDAQGAPRIEAVTIDFTAHTHWAQWTDRQRPHRSDIPINYEVARVDPYTKGGEKDLDATANRTMLSQRRKLLHDRLWGGGNDDNAIYGWLVRFFLSKIHDERTTNQGEAYALQVKHEGSRKEPATTTVARLNEVWKVAYKKYIQPKAKQVEPLTGGLFSDVDVAWVVETMQGLSLTAAGKASGDLLGSFFEAITRDGFKQSKGLFFTHFNIATFMIEALDLPTLAEELMRDNARHSNDRLPYVMDPSAGSGTFLLAAMRAITAHLDSARDALATNDDVIREIERWVPRDNPNQWAAQFLYGTEKREDLTISTKVNMVLHQDGSTHVYNHDALAPLNDIASAHSEAKFRTSDPSHQGYTKQAAETMDVIITNPPFSISLDGAIQRTLAATFELEGEANSENLFVERWYQLLKPKGRLAAVMPESTFSTAENAAVRRFIFTHFHVRAVVSLPPHTFQPWTPTRTSILFAQKKTPQEESEWREAFAEAHGRHALTKRAAVANCRTLLKPRKRDTEETLTAMRAEVVEAGATLGLPLEDADLTGDALPATAARIRGVDVDQLAFAEAVRSVAADDSYLGITVGEVGYKRTKRGENDRRNELFVAQVPRGDEDGDARPLIVRNLNDAPDAWQMVIGQDADDALSQLRRAKLWR